MKKLSEYELLGEVGRGGMGVVYLARNRFLGRLVALKSMSSSTAGNKDLLQTFYHEARLASSLRHPNIVTIYDLGEEAGIPFIVMEFVGGQSLDGLIASRVALPLSLKLMYALQACRAFDYSHKRGVIHQDIKPSNVIVNRAGTVTVVDFGIARVLGKTASRTDMLVGTYAYMAPEQYEGRPTDERSDIWSFGVLLYELLSYRPPFWAESVSALAHNIRVQEPVPIGQLVPNCPSDLQSLVQRMLRKSEMERAPTMESVLVQLDAICKPLRAEELSRLFEQGQKLFEQGEFEQASHALLPAIQIENSMKQKGDYTQTPIRMLYERIQEKVHKRKPNEYNKDWTDTRLKLLRTTLLSGALEDNALACSLDELIRTLGLDPLDPGVRTVCQEVETARMTCDESTAEGSA